MWNRQNTKMSKGFTLVEVMVAILIILVGLLGVFSATQRIISYITLSNSKLTASYLAQEGLELVRNIRDNNWLSLPASPWDAGLDNTLVDCSPTSPVPTGCEIDYDDLVLAEIVGTGNFLNIESASGFYGYNAIGNPTKFKRKITIEPEEDATLPSDGNYDILKVTVEIKWNERGADHNITVKGNLHDW